MHTDRDFFKKKASLAYLANDQNKSQKEVILGSSFAVLTCSDGLVVFFIFFFFSYFLICFCRCRTSNCFEFDLFTFFNPCSFFDFAALLCKIAALRSFSLDKLHYWRERASGMSSLAYFLSKDTIDHFNTIVKPVVYLSMFYFFNNPRSSFTDNYVVLLCLVYCVTGIAYWLAIFLEPSPAQLVSVACSPWNSLAYEFGILVILLFSNYNVFWFL